MGRTLLCSSSIHRSHIYKYIYILFLGEHFWAIQTLSCIDCPLYITPQNAYYQAHKPGLQRLLHARFYLSHTNEYLYIFFFYLLLLYFISNLEYTYIGYICIYTRSNTKLNTLPHIYIYARATEP